MQTLIICFIPLGSQGKFIFPDYKVGKDGEEVRQIKRLWMGCTKMKSSRKIKLHILVLPK